MQLSTAIRKIRIPSDNCDEQGVLLYNLDAIIAVGYRVNSYEATQFRVWAREVLKEYIIKGFVMDDERLKGKNPFGADYFEELLDRIREIRTSERLYRYLLFFRLFPKIVAAVRPQLLPWAHYRELIRVDNPDARAWYEQEALQEGWSTRTLHRNIASQYYFRLLKSQHQENVREEMHQLTTAYEQDKLEFIKNPVVAEFLGLQTDIDYTETKLESSIISHMQKFIMEMGKGFAFVARQQHIRTDMGDYYIDLVFYNYILKCFFLIDLKTTQISHQDVGQMDMYVRMYDELKRSEGDNPTIGLLLCSETSEDMARYSVLNSSSQLFQAKYLTYLPTQEELRREIERQKAVFELYNREEDGQQNV